MQKNRKYKLYALLLHIGGLRGGHYKAVCYNTQKKAWVEYDDSHVRKISLEEVHLEDIYGVFYQIV